MCTASQFHWVLIYRIHMFKQGDSSNKKMGGCFLCYFQQILGQNDCMLLSCHVHV